jgi:hypothetical protein
MGRQSHLLEIVQRLGAGGSFPNLLDRRHQQPNQNGDDRNHHQQFD